MEIAEMTEKHIPAVLSLWEGTEGIGLDEDVDNPQAIGRYLKRNPGMCFVAFEEGKLIGAVLCGTEGRRGYLNHLAVVPAFRRRGIGSALVEKGLAALKKAGIGKCNLFLYRDNDPGRRFWEKTGWQVRENLVVVSKVY